MHLLVFTPTWTAGDEFAIHPDCQAAIESQNLAGDYTWWVRDENRWPVGDHRNVLEHYQAARQALLDGQCDALVTLEHDNVLPDAGALQRLWDTPGLVIYAPYLLRHGRPLLSTWQYIGDRNLGMSLSNYPDELARAKERNIWRVSGTGMGCTLFRREVLERFPFEASDSRNPCPDLGFAENVLRAGVESFARFDVPVGHAMGKRVIWPFEEIERMEYMPRENLNAMAAGRFVRLRKGKPIELSDAEAEELTRLGVLDAALSQPAQQPDPDEGTALDKASMLKAIAIAAGQTPAALDGVLISEADELEEDELLHVARPNRRKTLKSKA